MEEEDPRILCRDGSSHSECSRLCDLIRLASALCTGVTLLDILWMAMTGHWYGVLMESIFLPGYFAAFLLSSNSRLFFTAHLFVINFVLNSALGTLIFFSPDFGYHYYLLVVPTLVWILFPGNRISKIAYSVIAFALFFYCEFLPDAHSLNTVEKGSRITFGLNILIFSIGSMICIRYYSSNMKKETSSLTKMASTDPLTGLENRRFFNHTAAADFSSLKDENKSLSILMVDLDHFKEINDYYGHDAGDKVLRKVAQSLNSSFRSADKVCRFGGEEFLILLKGTGNQDSLRIAEEVRQKIALLEFPGYPEMKITTSIGVAHMVPEDLELNQVIMRADKALYYAKNAGRNCVKDDQNSSIILCTI